MAAVDLSLSGLASGFDWKTLVANLADAERAPETRLRNEQASLSQQNNAYSSVKTELGVLQNIVKDLSSAAFFDSRLANAPDATIATAKADAGAPLGSYVFNFTQLAAAAKQVGTAGVGNSLSATNDVSGLVLSSAPFATAVTEGKITVNGRQVTIAKTDTLQQVFANINVATGGAVTGSYDSVTDRISLNSSGPIVLGSATDTSNFLQVARLNNNGTGTVASAAQLGVINQAASLSAANFVTAVSDGGAGAGEFKINGVSISFAATDSVTAVLKRINDSAAGVSASLDTVSDRFVLTNKTTGDIGVGLEDVTGNFLAATGLSAGTLTRGKNLLYTVDGGSQLVSQSNTITEVSSNISGLAVTALSAGSTTVSVATDTANVKSRINDFITEYNKVQTIIDSQTASTTDAKGVVTAGVLAGDNDAADLAAVLRRSVTGQVSGLTGVLKRLEDMGIVSNGNDNTLKLDDETKLDAALTTNLNTVKTLFTDPANGLATKLAVYLDKTIGDGGTLLARQDRLTKQSAEIDTQIADFERQVQADSDRLTQSFIAMETAQAQINQQLQYLQQQLGTTTSTSKTGK